MITSFRFFQFAAPARFYRLAGLLVPVFWAAFAVLAVAGLYVGFFRAPTDATQGDAYRIIFIHVPAAWMSMVLYIAMAFWAAIGWAFNARLASIVARAIAPTGAIFTFLALWTGAFWGKPAWGTWWVWDARLTSELILLFLYMGYMGLRSALIRDPVRSAKSAAILAVIGMVDIPIIHFSVEWWATLHQGATLAKFAKPSIAPEMLYPLLSMIAAFALFYAVLL